MLESFAVGFELMVTPATLLLLLAGVTIGILFGATPGLTTSMGMAFMLPLTYILQTAPAMALLIGLYIGGTSGGLITATLLGIPGTPGAIATTFDGYPMSQNGRPGEALGYGIVSSFVGGMLSLTVLFFAAPVLARFAIRFGPADYFSVSLFSLSLVAGLTGKSMIKGLLSGLIGLKLATIGAAPLVSTSRFTMGMGAFDDGLKLLTVLVGVYAVSELIRYAEVSHERVDDLHYHGTTIKGLGVRLRDFKGQVVNLLRSTAMGAGIGILPGIGAGTSNIMAYSAAKTSSKYPERFGSGIKDGVIAAEASNNAVTGGAMIPLLTLGIPGDAGTAILLAGLTLHGIAPGPLVFERHSNLIYGVFAALIIANLFMALVLVLGVKFFLKLVQVPKHYLLTVIFVLCSIGAFGLSNRVFDVTSIVIAGLIGYILHKFEFTVTPLVMGFILGPIVERNLLRGLMFTDGSFLAFFYRPISAVFLILTALYLGYVVMSTVHGKRNSANGSAA